MYTRLSSSETDIGEEFKGPKENAQYLSDNIYKGEQADAQGKNSDNQDEEDAGGEGDSGVVPPVPFDIVQIHCPRDCMIMYPVQPRKSYASSSY